MRIATTTFQNDAVSQIDALQAALGKIQQQLSTGLKVRNAADDPAGVVTVNQLTVEVSASTQFVTNGTSAQTNLQLEGQALTDATNVLQNANTLAVQANNASLSPAQRGDIATELQQDLQSLVSIANRQGSSGAYLFGGIASTAQPFLQANNTVTYVGAQQVDHVQIDQNQSISVGDTGATAFVNIPSGNGTFVTAAAAANTGSASISPGTVLNPSQLVPGNYSIAFSSPTNYTVTDGAGNTVASGTYNSGDSIQFNGIEVTLNGTPAAGDSFSISPAGTTSAFDALSSLIATLRSGTLNGGQRATQIGAAVQQINNTITNFSNVSASVGSRLNAITASQAAAQTNQTTLQGNIGTITNTDYAAATSALSGQELALQAASQSYASIEGLSLFQFIK